MAVAVPGEAHNLALRITGYPKLYRGEKLLGHTLAKAGNIPFLKEMVGGAHAGFPKGDYLGKVVALRVTEGKHASKNRVSLEIPQRSST